MIRTGLCYDTDRLVLWYGQAVWCIHVLWYGQACAMIRTGGMVYIAMIRTGGASMIRTGLAMIRTGGMVYTCAMIRTGGAYMIQTGLCYDRDRQYGVYMYYDTDRLVLWYGQAVWCTVPSKFQQTKPCFPSCWEAYVANARGCLSRSVAHQESCMEWVWFSSACPLCEPFVCLYLHR